MMETLMEICVNRDSVDSDNGYTDHTIKLEIPNVATYEDLFCKLKQMDYFPTSIAEYDVWVLTLGQFKCIFSYYAFSDKFCKGSSTYSLEKLVT